MTANSPGRFSVATGMRYRRAPEAIDWLCQVLGFEKHVIYPGPNDTILHAQLIFGTGMVMLGSLNENEYSNLMKQPDEIGGAETRSISLTVPDADAVHARVVQAGAEIVFNIEDKAYGGRGFTCRDPEGHIWDIGTYDPWQQPT